MIENITSLPEGIRSDDLVIAIIGAVVQLNGGILEIPLEAIEEFILGGGKIDVQHEVGDGPLVVSLIKSDVS